MKFLYIYDNKCTKHLHGTYDLYLMSYCFFGIKEKIDNFDTCSVFLAIATNIPQHLRLVLWSRVTFEC